MRRVVGTAELASPLDSPLSVVTIYNRNSVLSSVFMQFYVFHKCHSITSGESHKKPLVPLLRRVSKSDIVSTAEKRP